MFRWNKRKPSTGALDFRNPQLALIFHRMYQDLNKGSVYQPATENIKGQQLIEADYLKYFALVNSRSMSPDEAFNAAADDIVRRLSVAQKAGDGVQFGLGLLTAVIFGIGPGYAKAINADPAVTTLGLLAHILGRGETVLARGDKVCAAWQTIVEFIRGCQAGAPTSGVSVPRLAAQSKLAEEMRKRGVDFMSLHPTIHGALISEVIVFGRVERTVEMFIETAENVGALALSDEEKAAKLVELWKARGEMLTNSVASSSSSAEW